MDITYLVKRNNFALAQYEADMCCIAQNCDFPDVMLVAMASLRGPRVRERRSSSRFVPANRESDGLGRFLPS